MKTDNRLVLKSTQTLKQFVIEGRKHFRIALVLLYYPKRHVFNLFSLWKFAFTL